MEPLYQLESERNLGPFMFLLVWPSKLSAFGPVEADLARVSIGDHDRFGIIWIIQQRQR